MHLPTRELYNRTPRDPNQHDPVTYAALTGESVNGADVATDDRFVRVDFGGAERADMGFTSLVVIPLKNNQQQVIGALGLADARAPDPRQIIAFDVNLQQMMESYSSLAVAALEASIREQALHQAIQELRIEIDEVRRQKHVSAIIAPWQHHLQCFQSVKQTLEETEAVCVVHMAETAFARQI